MGVPGSGFPACDKKGNADGGAPREGFSRSLMLVFGVEGETAGVCTGVSKGFECCVPAPTPAMLPWLLLLLPLELLRVGPATLPWESEGVFEWDWDDVVGEAGACCASDERRRWWLRGRIALGAAGCAWDEPAVFERTRRPAAPWAAAPAG